MTGTTEGVLRNRVRRSARFLFRARFLCLPVIAASTSASAQDTASVTRLRGLRVEVARPSTTTGGTSAVEIAADSLSVVAAPTAEEFLRRMPLVQMRSNSRGEVQPDLRGADDRQIAVLLDGIPLTLGWDHRTDLSIIPLTAVRTVTLLRGLSSMLHGPNVLGGALEFNVARGQSAQTGVQPFAGAFSVDHQGGTNIGATSGASFAQDYTNWFIRAGGGYRDSPGTSLPDGAHADPELSEELLTDADGRRLNSDRQLSDVFLSVRHQRSRGGWFSSLVTAASGHRGVPPEAHVSDPRLWRYPEQNRLVVAMSGGTAQWQNTLGQGHVEAAFGLDRSSSEIEEYASAAYRSVVGSETGLSTTMTGRVLGDYLFSAGPEVRSAFTLANVKHNETVQDGQSFDYQQRLWSLGTEVEIGNTNDSGSGGGNTMWSFGASLDGADTPLSGDKPPLRTIWDWGMRTGVTVLGAGGNIMYHAGVSRRTRFPSLRELYSGALGRFEPNPDLRPESLKAGEVGITVTVGDARLQLVGFHQRLSDGIVRTRSMTNEGIRFKRVNRDDIRSTGVELLAAGTRGRLDFGGDVTLKRVRVLDPSLLGDDGQRAEYEPAVSATLNFGVLAPEAVTVSGFLRYRGIQYCENVEITGLDRMDSSATLDLEAMRIFQAGGRASGRRLTGTVGVANLTDSVVLDQCGLPQPGRTLRIQFNIR